MATTDFRITRLSKVIAALLFALWAVSYFVPETVSYLALVPGRCGGVRTPASGGWRRAPSPAASLCSGCLLLQDFAMCLEPRDSGLRDNKPDQGACPPAWVGHRLTATPQLAGPQRPLSPMGACRLRWRC